MTPEQEDGLKQLQSALERRVAEKRLRESLWTDALNILLDYRYCNSSDLPGLRSRIKDFLKRVYCPDMEAEIAKVRASL